MLTWSDAGYGRDALKSRSVRDSRSWGFRIEIKPQLDDNFPSVLRQMERNKADYLLIGSFEASNCSLEQVRAYFATKGMKIIALSEIEARIEKRLKP